MSAKTTIEKILNTNLKDANLKVCFVDKNKIPYRIDKINARPNMVEDFTSITELYNSKYINDFEGIGMSVQGSKICAIDIDKCISIPNDISSINEKGKEVLDFFKDVAYCEFSFSGTGLRILFKADLIENYSTKYYIKNSKEGIEFYQPYESFRYVTLTGNTIYDNPIQQIDNDITNKFLDKYMQRNIAIKETNVIEEVDLEKVNVRLRVLCFKDMRFQNLWFGQAPGSGKDESERDFQIISMLYEKVTSNKDIIKQLFEDSPYFKSKDWKHKHKWEYNNNRYYNYIYSHIKGE